MSNPNHIEFGKYSEDLATQSLTQQGYKILERNFRTPWGEIDIIAEEGDTLCFIEVKARNTRFEEFPLEAVSRIKQRKLIRVAWGYLKKNNFTHRRARFDVVAIFKGEDNLKYKIEIIKNAFGLEE